MRRNRNLEDIFDDYNFMPNNPDEDMINEAFLVVKNKDVSKEDIRYMYNAMVCSFQKRIGLKSIIFDFYKEYIREQ